MKIAMLTDKLALGGGPECIRLIAKYLPQHEFTIFAKSGYFSALEKLPNVKIEYKFPTRDDLNTFDLIHCHHLRPLLHLHAPKNIPVINTIHGIHSRQFDYKSGFKNTLFGIFRKMLERYLFSRIAVNIALTSDD